MNHKYLLIEPFSPLITLFVTTFILVAKKASCIDSQFLACAYRNCGFGPNISYPFYIQGVQESYCGYPYPGFNISCKNNLPILRLSNNDYIIHQIFYENSTLHVSNAAFFNASTNCNNIPSIQNLSLPGDRFMLSANHSFQDLLLLYHCNLSLVNGTNLTRYQVDCSGDTNKTNSTIAIFEDDALSRNASEMCGKIAVAPVLREIYRGNQWGTQALEEVLKRGLVFNWKANYCRECTRSGGRCGIHESTLSFRCFCPDRPHRVRCKHSGELRYPL